MNKDNFLNSGLLEQYILGLTTPEEDRIVEQHAQAYPEVAEELRQLKQAMDAYASEHVVPSPNKKIVEQSSFSSINGASQNAIFNWSLLFAIIFAGTTLYLFQAHRADQHRIEQLEAEFAALQEYYDHDHAQETEQLSMTEEAQDPRTVSSVLKSTENDNSFLVYHRNTATRKNWLDVTQIPLLDDQLQYQVWAKTAEDVVLLGAITSNERRMIALPYLENVTNIMVTSTKQPLSDLSGEENILFEAEL